jgi:molybdate transport system substrate-binding protein
MRCLLAGIVVYGLGLCTTACGSGRTPAPVEGARDPAVLSIAAASDLRYALDEVVQGFRGSISDGSPESAVSVSYGSSGSFFAQLVNGAPFDVFLSADISYARQLIDQGVAIPDSLFTYAEGHLVLWVPAGSTIPVADGFVSLTDPSVARVAIANPVVAPYGRAAEAALKSAEVYGAVEPKLVLGENVSQALQFVESGSADIGIVPLSLALAPPVAAKGRYWRVPAHAHPPIEQGGVTMRRAVRRDVADAFRAFLLSREARVILARYGFTAPEH